MKNKKLIILVIVLVLLFLFIITIFLKNIFIKDLVGLSSKTSVNISCDKEKVMSGSNVTCSIYVNALFKKISSFTGDIKLSNNLDLVSSNYSSNWSDFSTAKNGEFKLSTPNFYNGEVSIGNFVVKANGVDRQVNNITLENIRIGDENYDESSFDDVTKTIYISSSNANLIDLSVDVGTLVPSFSESVNNYNVITNSSSILINAIAPEYGSVTGHGKKNLEYGNNTFTIISTSESGNKKEYIINVIRNDTRSSNNSLSNLSVSNTSINFDSNVYNYTSSVGYDVSSIDISATTRDSKASVQGLGLKQLKVGKNTFNIVVMAENKKVRVYTVTIIRANKDGSVSVSNNNNLKSLKLENATINFDKDTLFYEVYVPYETSNANITYETESNSAKAEIKGNTNLQPGENNIEIIITAEDGSIKTYKLKIIRDNMLTSENGEEEILSKLKDILGENNIVVNVLENDENKFVSSKIINELMNTNKILSYNVVDEKGKILYNVKIKGEELENENEFSYYLTFKSDYEKKLKSLTKEKLYLPLNFEFSGPLPGKIEFNVYVKDILDTTKTYDLYYFNTKNNILELETNEVPITDGYASFELNHFSEYVLLEKKVYNNKKSIISIIIMVIVAFIISGVIIYLINKKKGNITIGG